MKFILSTLFLVCVFMSKAQTHNESFIACDSSYNVICDLQTANKIKVSIINGLKDTDTTNYFISTNSFELFANIFYRNFRGKHPSCADSTAIISFARKLYFNFIAANTEDTLTPVAGLLKVKDSVSYYEDYKTKGGGHSVFKAADISLKFKIIKVTGEINDGYIENIKVSVAFPDGIHYFSVPYPIGISSIANFKKYSSTKLYDLNSDIYLKGATAKQRKDSSVNNHAIVDSSLYILLSDVIDYDYYFGVNRRDFSPKNMTLGENGIDGIAGGQSMLLKKEDTHKLFEADIFTDFIGLKEDKPNGLIQTDVIKRINTNAKQHLAPRLIYWLFKSYGGFQYVAPSITISKLEDHNKFLILGDLDSLKLNDGQIDMSRLNKSAHRFLTGINLYQHQSFSAGVDVNLGYLNNHDLKFNLYLNAGIRLGITPVRDSLTTIAGGVISKTGFVNDHSINTIQFTPQLILNFLPEERFNLSISDKLIFIKPLDQNVQLFCINKSDGNILNAYKSGCLNIAELLMTIQLNKTSESKLFARVIFNSDWKNVYNNFAQIQIGYSTFILGNK